MKSNIKIFFIFFFCIILSINLGKLNFKSINLSIHVFIFNKFTNNNLTSTIKNFNTLNNNLDTLVNCTRISHY